MQISQDQIDEFITNGFSLIDGAIPMDMIDAASQAVDDFYEQNPEAGGNQQFIEGPAFEAIYQLPSLEQIAQQVLGEKQLKLRAGTFLHTPPQEGSEPWHFEREHIDVRFAEEEWLQEPRRIVVTFMIFLDDVIPGRAPTTIRPGSHLQLAKHTPAHYYDHTSDHCALSQLPKLPYADAVPLCGKKGQLAIATTAAIHFPSSNVTDKARKIMFVVFAPADLPIINAREDERQAFFKRLSKRFAADRRHLAENAVGQKIVCSFGCFKSERTCRYRHW